MGSRAVLLLCPLVTLPYTPRVASSFPPTHPLLGCSSSVVPGQCYHPALSAAPGSWVGVLACCLPPPFAGFSKLLLPSLLPPPSHSSLPSLRPPRPWCGHAPKPSPTLPAKICRQPTLPSSLWSQGVLPWIPHLLRAPTCPPIRLSPRCAGAGSDRLTRVGRTHLFPAPHLVTSCWQLKTDHGIYTMEISKPYKSGLPPGEPAVEYWPAYCKESTPLAQPTIRFAWDHPGFSAEVPCLRKSLRAGQTRMVGHPNLFIPAECPPLGSASSDLCLCSQVFSCSLPSWAAEAI